MVEVLVVQTENKLHSTSHKPPDVTRPFTALLPHGADQPCLIGERVCVEKSGRRLVDRGRWIGDTS